MRRKCFWIGLFSLFVVSAVIWAYSGGPPQDRAGNPPGNMTCKSSGCHNSFAINAGDGVFTIDNVPPAFTPGKAYSLTVTLSDPGQQRWGFELTVLDGDDHQAGTIEVTDHTHTQSTDNPGQNPDFIMHKSAGTFAGTSNGPISWSFDWIAPSQVSGAVTFYAAGNAADNNGTSAGDYIYATSITSSPFVCERGDVTNDGTVNVFDVLTAVNHMLDVAPLSADGICRADCNGDGALNVLDLLGIVNLILGIGNCAP